MDKDMDKKLDKLCELKERMVGWVETYINSGPQNIDVKQLGEAVDIIKDFAEAEKYCRQACYYKTVTDAMVEDPQPKEGRFGYSGRYGYKPMVDQESYIDAYLHDPNFAKNIRMGYNDMTGNAEKIGNTNPRYGDAYNNYRQAKKHYTQTNSASDKAEMETYINEHLADVLTTLRQMWVDADQNVRKRIKTDLTGVVNEMTV